MNVFFRALESVRARIVYPYITNNFEKTSYGKKIATYKDMYSGKRCFLIGNGPSLTADDLTRLHDMGEVTFAFNRIYNIFDMTPWRPTFYISQDEKMLAGSINEVNALTAVAKFIPIRLKWWHGIDIEGATFFNILEQHIDDPTDFLFSDDPSRAIYNSSTCMYTAAQFALYMGFSEIYLIGVDHHFKISQNNKGEIVVDNNAKDYFSDKYNEDKDKLYIPNTEKSTLTYEAMRLHCEKRGAKVFNATRGGKLEVFPRVDFDSLWKEGDVSFATKKLQTR